MPVRTKRWNDPRDPDDGFRLLITRYRPRALPRRDETWDAWSPALGPSKTLLAAFQGARGPALPWAEYAAYYTDEMAHEAARIDELARRVASGETITLLCAASCLDPRRCHRTLLARLIEHRAAALTAR